MPTDRGEHAEGDRRPRAASSSPVVYNAENGIDPQTIRKAVGDILSLLRPDDTAPMPGKDRVVNASATRCSASSARCPSRSWVGSIQTLEEEMHEAAADLKFEYAARLRDEVKELRREFRDAG